MIFHSFCMFTRRVIHQSGPLRSSVWPVGCSMDGFHQDKDIVMNHPQMAGLWLAGLTIHTEFLCSKRGWLENSPWIQLISSLQPPVARISRQLFCCGRANHLPAGYKTVCNGKLHRNGWFMTIYLSKIVILQSKRWNYQMAIPELLQL